VTDDPATTCIPHPPPTADGSPRSFDPAWRTETVLALAKGIEAERAFDRLPILADALEEAGCDDEVLLRHCRGCEWHEEECWALSLALDRPPPMTPEQVLEMINRLAARTTSQPAATPAQTEEDVSARTTLLRCGGLLLVLVIGVGRVLTSLSQKDKPPNLDIKPIPVDRLFNPVDRDEQTVDELTARRRAKLERIGREIDQLADHGPPDPNAVWRKQLELWIAYEEAKKTAELLHRLPPKRPSQLVGFHPLAPRD
jgi:hypothetical protein